MNNALLLSEKFPGISAKVCAWCILVGRNARTSHPWKGLAAPGRVWPAWEECSADHLHGMEKNCCCVLKGLICRLAGLSLSVGTRHTS